VWLIGDAFPRIDAVPFEEAGVGLAIAEEAVVGDDNAFLGRVAAFEVRSVADVEVLAKIKEDARLEVVNSHFNKEAFHCLKINAVGWIGEMSEGGGDAVLRHAVYLSTLSTGVNNVWSDDALIRGVVDKPVSVDAMMCVYEFHLHRVFNSIEAEASIILGT
jgi:hypothetical protein